MGDLSAHFSRSEFQCHHWGRPQECPTFGRPVDEALVDLLERIRATVGGPCVIVSGWRCSAYNKAIGGARSSQHLLGRAADLHDRYVTSGVARSLGARGVGIADSGSAVHVDVRSGRRATWRY